MEEPIVISIDIIKDGGTIIVRTINKDYYINKDTKRLHSSYPISNENLINDPTFENHINQQINK